MISAVSKTVKRQSAGGPRTTKTEEPTILRRLLDEFAQPEVKETQEAASRTPKPRQAPRPHRRPRPYAWD